MSLLEKENQSQSILEGFKHYVYFQILELRLKFTLGQSIEQLSVDQDGLGELVWLVVVCRVGIFLDRNFSKLPLLYETINKFHHSLYFCSYYYYLRAARGNLGGLGSIFCLRIIFQDCTLYEEVLIQLSFNASSHCFRFVFIKPIG